MFAWGAEVTVDRPLEVRLELVRFLDRHRHIPGEIHVGGAASAFRDMRRNGVRRACDLISQPAPVSGKQPGKRGGIEGKHMGFLPDLKFPEIRHAGKLAATWGSAVTILSHEKALQRGL